MKLYDRGAIYLGVSYLGGTMRSFHASAFVSICDYRVAILLVRSLFAKRYSTMQHARFLRVDPLAMIASAYIHTA